jgi:hypothetical protein
MIGVAPADRHQGAFGAMTCVNYGCPSSPRSVVAACGGSIRGRCVCGSDAAQAHLARGAATSCVGDVALIATRFSSHSCIADLSNVAGYAPWCRWLIVMPVVLGRAAAPAPARTAAPAVAARG